MPDIGIPSSVMLRAYNLPPEHRDAMLATWHGFAAEALAGDTDRHAARAQATDRLERCEFYGRLVVEYGPDVDDNDGAHGAGVDW
jgi:hypothetical protein